MARTPSTPFWVEQPEHDFEEERDFVQEPDFEEEPDFDLEEPDFEEEPDFDLEEREQRGAVEPDFEQEERDRHGGEPGVPPEGGSGPAPNECSRPENQPSGPHRAQTLNYLRARGVTESLSDAARLQALDARTTAGVAGSMVSCGRSSIRIPFHGLDGEPIGFERLRFIGEPVGFAPTKDDKKPRRFHQKPGTDTPAYLTPGQPWRKIAIDTSIDLWITEGEIKALAACHAGFPTIGILGVQNWHMAGDKDRPVRFLDAFEMKGRNIFVAFDSDAATNPNVLQAERELRRLLERRGAFVQIVRLHPTAVGAKQGLDDLLVNEGPDALRKLRDSASRLPDTLDAGGELLDVSFPPVTFAIDPYLPKGELVEIHGAHGQFKSTLMLYACLSVATGEPWGSEVPVPAGRSVFISLEDKTATLAYRARRWVNRGEDPAADAVRESEVRARFSCLGREKAAPLVLTKTEYGQAVIQLGVVDRLVKLCAGTDLIVLETAGRLHPGAETNEALAVLATALETIATRTGACVCLVRHVSKEVARSKAADSYGGRGGGSLADACRSVLAVKRDGVRPEDAVRILHAKATHSAPGPDLVWSPQSDQQGGVFLRAAGTAARGAATTGSLLAMIREADEEGLTTRELLRAGGWKAAEIAPLLRDLTDRGEIVPNRERRSKSGPKTFVYRTPDAYARYVARSSAGDPNAGVDGS